jgi:hypothetical protein
MGTAWINEEVAMMIVYLRMLITARMASAASVIA